MFSTEVGLNIAPRLHELCSLQLPITQPLTHKFAHNVILIPSQIIAFDELKTDYKNPIDQCNSLNPLVLPEYVLHIFFNALFLIAGEFFSLFLNVPLIGYHVHR